MFNKQSKNCSACELFEQVKYKLAKTGFMKRFEGTWKIEPLFLDDSGAPVQVHERGTERVASMVTLQQVTSIALVNYIHLSLICADFVDDPFLHRFKSIDKVK